MKRNLVSLLLHHQLLMGSLAPTTEHLHPRAPPTIQLDYDLLHNRQPDSKEIKYAAKGTQLLLQIIQKEAPVKTNELSQAIIAEKFHTHQGPDVFSCHNALVSYHFSSIC